MSPIREGPRTYSFDVETVWARDLVSSGGDQNPCEVGFVPTGSLEDPTWICAHGPFVVVLENGVGLLGLFSPERYGLFGVWAVSPDGPPNGSKKSFVWDSVELEGRDLGDEAFKGH